MNEELRLSLDNNAKEWRALSHAITSAEKVVFDKIHDGLFATYGPNFMAHVYRTAFEQMLQNTPDAERDKLLAVFQQATEVAIAKHYYELPTIGQCQACHSRHP